MSFVLISLVLLSSTADKPSGYAKPELLVEPADLAKATADQWHVFDARGKGKYIDGHAPAAAWIDATTRARAFGEGEDQAAWEKRLGELGITTDATVVLYDDSQSKDAARMWWILRYWGVKDVRLVNGGWKGYLASGGPIEKGERTPARVTAKLSPQRERLATKAQLKEWIRSGKAHEQIVDSRSSGEYCGTEQTAKRNGAIPGATHLEWSDTLDPKTGRFKSSEELTRIFHEAGIDPAQPASTYCQSGGRASVMAFVLELMGGKEVRNYYKSWADWGNDPDTPIVKPQPKK
jgi:thiosulfate/3-mercaptopyruvate sulfurtransferase